MSNVEYEHEKFVVQQQELYKNVYVCQIINKMKINGRVFLRVFLKPELAVSIFIECACNIYLTKLSL